MNLMKGDIIKSGNKYLIGGIRRHRVEEHLIVVKSIIPKYMKSGVIIQLVDIEIFFDSEILRTVMTSLTEAKVNRCLFKQNEGTEISVAMPVGLTSTAEVKEIVAQGSGGAALANGANIAQGLDTML